MKDVDITTIGGRIRKARVNRRLTTQELAERVGVTQNYLSVIERNNKKQASPALLEKIADATGVPLEWLKDGVTAPVKRASCSDDIQLLLTLIMQNGKGITEETVAAVLGTDVETVNGILAGTVSYNQLWEGALQTLVQRLDLPAVRRKLQNLDILFQQEDEKKVNIILPKALLEYFTHTYDSALKYERKPILVPDNPSYIYFELKNETSSETWTILYYPLAYEEDFQNILNQAEPENQNIKVAVAFPDSDICEKMSCFYERKRNELELIQDLNAERGMPSGSGYLPSFMLLCIDGDAVKEYCDLYYDPYEEYGL